MHGGPVQTSAYLGGCGCREGSLYSSPVPALGVQGALSESRLGNGRAGQGAGRSVATGRWAFACLSPHGTASAPRRRDAHRLPRRARRAGAAAGGCCTSPPCGEARRAYGALYRTWLTTCYTETPSLPVRTHRAACRAVLSVSKQRAKSKHDCQRTIRTVYCATPLPGFTAPS